MDRNFITEFNEEDFLVDSPTEPVGQVEEFQYFDESDEREPFIMSVEESEDNSVFDEVFQENFSEPENKVADTLPGSEMVIEDSNDDHEVVQTNWLDDRDVTKFIDHLREAFSSIPKHDGNSISGCERAIVYLNGINKDISEAVRMDSAGSLNDSLDEIEEYRVKILQGIVKLKNRISELKKKISEEAGTKKKASEEINIHAALAKSNEMLKKEGSKEIQLVMTPFERALAGILINSTVSAGQPFEDVYEFLKEKFELTPREELSLIQLVMDMGYPIFKDRGTIGESSKDDKGNKTHGIDFIKNYLA